MQAVLPMMILFRVTLILNRCFGPGDHMARHLHITNCTEESKRKGTLTWLRPRRHSSFGQEEVP